MRLNSADIWRRIEVPGTQTIKTRKYIVAAVAVLLSGFAAAQDTAADPANVWAVVERQWNEVEDGWKSLTWHGGSDE